MRVVGIIAEYNPFHNGHRYHLEQAKKQTHGDAVVCVMSGNFTQRGEPALWDKWHRARMAIQNGADLVLELPFVFACNNAEQFAYGAVEILHRLGCVTDIVFGSEQGQLQPLQQVAQLLWEEPGDFRQALQDQLQKGLSFPSARAKVLEAMLGEEGKDVWNTPNNSLGIEYLKQGLRLDTDITFHTIQRLGEAHHSSQWTGSLASASAIRNQLIQSDDIRNLMDAVPPQTMEVMRCVHTRWDSVLSSMDKLLRYRVCCSDTEILGQIYSITEGLEHKLKKAVVHGDTWESLIFAMKSKRYTHTRICRILCHVLMDLKRRDFHEIVDNKLLYGRVLGLNETGGTLLRRMKKEKRCTLPIISNLKQQQVEESKEGLALRYDVRAADVYNLMVYGELYTHSDFVERPFIAREQHE